MKLVLDASVAIKLVAPEADQDQALSLLRLDAERIAPEFLLVEAGNTFWKKVSRGELLRLQVIVGLDVVRDVIHRFINDADLAAEALELSIEIGHPVYDCLYLALAVREEAILVTADTRFAAKVAKGHLAGLVQPLAAMH